MSGGRLQKRIMFRNFEGAGPGAAVKSGEDGVGRRKSGSIVFRATYGHLAQWGARKRRRWRHGVSGGLWPPGGKRKT